MDVLYIVNNQPLNGDHKILLLNTADVFIIMKRQGCNFLTSTAELFAVNYWSKQ